MGPAQGSGQLEPWPVCIFIDGANLRYVLQTVLGKSEFDANATPLNPKWNWTAFLDQLRGSGSHGAMRGTALHRAYWYAPASVQRRDGQDPIKRTPKEVEYLNRVESQKRVARAVLRLDFVRTGVLIPKGDYEGVYTEKGVDVALALDLIEKADLYQVAVVVSRDADLVPAIQRVKGLGKFVSVPEFTKGGEHVVDHAEALIEAADWTFKVQASNFTHTLVGGPPGND